MRGFTVIAAAALIAICLAPAPSPSSTSTPSSTTATAKHRHHRPPPRIYAWRIAKRVWEPAPHPIEWPALDKLIGRYESGWDPCAHWPGVHHDCHYAGANACGIPQASPCPTSWRGHLYRTRYAQVRWLIAYIVDRYGTPVNALDHRLTFGWY